MKMLKMTEYKTLIWTAKGPDFNQQVLEMDQRLTKLAADGWAVKTCNSFRFHLKGKEVMVFHYLIFKNDE